MLVEQSRQFSQLDFIVLLFQKLKDKRIIEFNKKELENELHYYQKQDRYKSLFLDFEFVEGRIDLSKIINSLVIIGALKNIDTNPDMYYIVLGKNEYYKNIIFDEDIIYRLDSLVEEYEIRYKVAKSKGIKICSINPNENIKYLLCKGNHNKKIIEWNLETDANYYLCSSGKRKKLDVISPVNVNELITIKNLEYIKMVLKDATYALIQGKIDGKLESTILYTESLNPDEIESMIEVKDKVYKICK